MKVFWSTRMDERMNERTTKVDHFPVLIVRLEWFSFERKSSKTNFKRIIRLMWLLFEPMGIEFRFSFRSFFGGFLLATIFLCLLLLLSSCKFYFLLETIEKPIKPTVSFCCGFCFLLGFITDQKEFSELVRWYTKQSIFGSIHLIRSIMTAIFSGFFYGPIETL